MQEKLDQNLYVFVLGREKEIALEELKAVLHRFGLSPVASAKGDFAYHIDSVTGNTAVLNIDNASDSDVAGLISVLGGTVKIFKVVGSHTDGRQYTTEAILSTTPYFPSVIPAEAGISQSDRSPGDGVASPRMTEKENESRADREWKDDEDLLIESITDVITDLRKGTTGKLDFGISDYTGKNSMRTINKTGIDVKIELKKRQVNPRFVALRESKELTSIQTLKNNLDRKGIEIGIFDQGLGILIALNDPEAWSRRDYGKPAGDKCSGMLPPKLARAMINIALAGRTSSGHGNEARIDESESATSHNRITPDDTGLVIDKRFTQNSCLVVDPFCGSGNILMEALMLGCEVVGSDISEKAVRDTEANIDWLESNKELRIRNQGKILGIKQADATKYDCIKLINSYLEPFGGVEGERSSASSENNMKIFPFRGRMGRDDNYDIAIVTEPYLGQPKKFKPGLNAVKGEYEKIKILYLDFLKNFHTFLNCHSCESRNLDLDKIPGQARDDRSGVVFCVVFPLIGTLEGRQYSLYKNSIDEIKQLGYTEVRPPLVYGREYQVVKREIVFLEKR